jgi:hypothetical protein
MERETPQVWMPSMTAYTQRRVGRLGRVPHIRPSCGCPAPRCPTVYDDRVALPGGAVVAFRVRTLE